VLCRPLQLVAARDVGLAAANALSSKDPSSWAGRRLPLAGDELTPLQMCEAFSKAQGGMAVKHSSPPAWIFWFLSRCGSIGDRAVFCRGCIRGHRADPQGRTTTICSQARCCSRRAVGWVWGPQSRLGNRHNTSTLTRDHHHPCPSVTAVPAAVCTAAQLGLAPTRAVPLRSGDTFMDVWRFTACLCALCALEPMEQLFMRVCGPTTC
jgi:hypothetical protein